jgi:glycosyltransferase involved in cell wall biosynthesis
VKVLIDGRVLTHKKTTGIETHIKNLLNEFSVNNFDVLIPKYKNKYYCHFWEHIILPFKARKYDILFCPSNIAPLFLTKKIKLVLVLHDLAFIDFPQYYSKLFQKYYSFVIPQNIKRANKIVTVSKFEKTRIIKEFPNVSNKIVFIYHGIEKQFKINNKEKIIKKDYILYIGSFNEIKNFKHVISAYIKLNLKNIKLVMVMPQIDSFNISYDTKEILNEIKNNENIKILNFMEKNVLKKLYEEAKIFVLPSFHESFGFPFLEAMSSATPVITSKLTAIPEICGDAVVYCDPYDVDDIRKKMEMVLNNEKLQKKMIVKGLERAKKFTWEKSAKKYLKVFKEVLQN